MSDHAPELLLSKSAAAFLESLSDEYMDVVTTLYSLLANPEVDNRVKFSADNFPYSGAGTREFLDDSWYIAYRVSDRGDVKVSTIMRRREIDEIGLFASD